MKKLIAIILTLILSSSAFLTFASADDTNVCDLATLKLKNFEQRINNNEIKLEILKTKFSDKNSVKINNKLNTLIHQNNKLHNHIMEVMDIISLLKDKKIDFDDNDDVDVNQHCDNLAISFIGDAYKIRKLTYEVDNFKKLVDDEL